MGRSMQGLLELNGLFLLTGLAIVWAVRGWHSWLDLLDTAGIALMLGLGAVCAAATVVLSLGGGLSGWVVLGLCAGVAAPASIIAVSRSRPLPRGMGPLPPRTIGTLAAVVGALGTVAVLIAFFRVAHVTPLQGGDSFEFWVPKAKAIYFFDGLDERLFRALPGPSYPLLVPALQAMDFRLMGSADAPALAVQYWFLIAGFVFAAAALLRALVPAWLTWLFVGLAMVIPELDNRLLGAQADWTLDIFFALTALFAITWLRSREPLLLVGFGISLAAMLATKREGQLLAACLFVGLLAGSPRAWRTWLRLLAVGAVAYSVNIPWRLWWSSRQLASDAPSGGLDLTSHLSRVWPSFELVIRLLFAYDLWLVFVPLALVAALASITQAGSPRETARFYLTTVAVAVIGFTWILWSDPGLALDEKQSSTPIPRVVGSIVLLSTTLAPVLIEPLLRPLRSRRGTRRADAPT
jgi:hypothetical protein